MSSICEDFVSVWSAGYCKFAVLALEIEFRDGFVPRDVSSALMIEYDAFAIAGDFEEFFRFDLFGSRKVLCVHSS
jgi:hypothetical protein